MNVTKLQNKKRIGYTIALSMLFTFFNFFVYPFYTSVYGQFLSPTDDKSPLYLDSYWTDSPSTNSSPSDLTNPNRVEVGPGEGPSTLAVILVNTGRSDITGLKGYLSMPEEFRSIPGQNSVNSTNLSVASYNAIVKPGESFPLHFSVDVLRNATVGPYNSNLQLVYSKVQEIGQVLTTLDVPYRVTGKVILDTTSLTQNLTTGTLNEALIAIKNKGSADANGVITTITDLNGGTITNLGDSSVENIENNDSNNSTVKDDQKTENMNQTSSDITTIQATTFNIGKIPANGLVTINPLLYADYNAGGTIQTMNLQISYNDAYGNKKTSDTLIGLIVSPNPPESTLSVKPVDDNFISSGNEPEEETKNNEHLINEGNDQSDDRRESITITSGKIEEMKFVVTNTGDNVLKNTILSISSPSDSVKILGNTRWTVPLFTPNMEKEISTLVFASDDMINKPISFVIDSDYISGGKTRSDVLDLGAYVEGQIKITLYDVAVNEIGGFPNLVGNLLNEGNTMAFFTRIQAENSDSTLALSNNNNNNDPSTNPDDMNSSSEEQSAISATTNHNNESKLFSNLPPSQYLGDLTENSPLPFGIPINITKGLPSGEYPISLKVSFKDNLRNDHLILLNDTVEYKASTQGSEETSQKIFGIDLMNLIVLMVVLVTVIVLIVWMRKKRKKRMIEEAKKGIVTSSDSGNTEEDDENNPLFKDQSGDLGQSK